MRRASEAAPASTARTSVRNARSQGGRLPNGVVDREQLRRRALERVEALEDRPCLGCADPVVDVLGSALERRLDLRDLAGKDGRGA